MVQFDEVKPSTTPVEGGLRRLVVIGNGPVGLQVARQVLEQSSDWQVILFGDEECVPYNRVGLSSVLAGQQPWGSLEWDLEGYTEPRLVRRYGRRVERVDLAGRWVEDGSGEQTYWDRLVFATGSRPRVPSIALIELPGVFTLRGLRDTDALLARQVSSRHTVVLGGGLLGIEIARAMGRHHTRITLIEHAPRLLSRQVDDEAAQLLHGRLEKLGIELILDTGVRAVVGQRSVQGLVLADGREISCDTLIVATGILPNRELAMHAGIAVGRGIRVDDQMRTSALDVYAVGECCEHRDQIYGLVGPGLEQAGVAVHHLLGGEASYQGSIVASRLKVLDETVLSVGPMGDFEPAGLGCAHTWRDPATGRYRKILVHRNRLIGALAVGDWDEATRVQAEVGERGLILPWQVLRFRFTGQLWYSGDQPGVCDWPANATLCQCTGVTRGRVSEAIAAGARSCEQVSRITGASSVCGSCKPLVAELLSTPLAPEATPWHWLVTLVGGLSLLLALAFLLPLEVPYQDSEQVTRSWDWLWRDSFAKQVSGFTILGLFAVGLVVSLRKRIKWLHRLGDFAPWRLVHLVLGMLAVVALLAHTGLRLGSGLNFWLMLSFVGLLLLGAFNAALLGQQHRIEAALGGRLRKWSLRWHIFLFWPVPVLLAFHVLKGYWY